MTKKTKPTKLYTIEQLELKFGQPYCREKNVIWYRFTENGYNYEVTARLVPESKLWKARKGKLTSWI